MEEEEDDAPILEPYEICFSDLMLLTSGHAPSPDSTPEETERLQSIVSSIMQNLGSNGPGLLTVTGVPNASRLRRKLLPLARRLALLNTDDRKRVLKEHNLGSDVPLKNLDRVVSSFAMQLKYVQDVNSNGKGATHGGNGYLDEENQCPATELRDPQDTEFENLGNYFKELGFCMMDLGIRLARVCDQAIGGNELEQSLLESCTAKGRLIHYHSTLDNLILKEAASERRKSTKMKANPQPDTARNEAKSCGSSSLWQQWHYDYGVFTILTSPVFLLPSRKESNGDIWTCPEEEYSIPRMHTNLQVFVPSKNSVQMVKASPESLIVQVGESADILSKGKLRANLHSVSRSVEDLSRETFVVFLQPAWTKRFSLADYPAETCTTEEEEDIGHQLGEELHRIVPRLSSRLRDGMTFAEFSRETTKQYYGGNGLQPNR